MRAALNRQLEDRNAGGLVGGIRDLVALGIGRAMLDHLVRVLPPARQQPLQKELHLLHKAVERGFPDEEDRDRAAVGDYQGMGGSES